MSAAPHRALAPAFALALLSLAGCADDRGNEPVPHAQLTEAEGDVKLVDEDRADLVLYVSNQSFEDEEVRLTITVDDVTVVDDDFHVEGQHNWISFPLGMPKGVHRITAESDSGAVLDESFRVPGDKPRYAVIDHWGEAGSADLTWMFQREPVAFA